MKSVSWLRWVIAATIGVAALCPQGAQAQTPARFYWKTLSDANAVPIIVNSISGNSNPFDPAHVVVSADAQVDATMALAGWAHTFTLFNRSALGAVIVPMGRLSGSATVAGRTLTQSANGFGDPMIEFDLNVIGPRAQRSIPDALRYEPGFSVDLLADLAMPIGKYDNTQPLNLGQNRWYGRLGAPVVWQLGPWVPGRRTTLEFLPVVWLFGANDDYVGQTLETDPMFQLDAHLTRDFTEHFWGSFDTTWYTGGRPTVSGVAGENLNNFGLGFALGYTINDNLGLTVGYKSTVDDLDPGDLQMDSFTVSLVYGWHSLIEGAKRLRAGVDPVELHQVSDHCFAVLNEKNRVCDANSGLINLGGGVVIDTQSDLAHARRMIEMFGKVWTAMPRRVINTHEDADHVWGNQLFEGAEIIAHRSVPDRMKQVADPAESQKLLHGVGRLLTHLVLKMLHPGLPAAGEQLLEDYDFDGIELVLPTTLFDARYELDLDGTEVHLIYVGPCHQVGDTIIHVPKERVVFAGDVLFRQCTPMGWTGTYDKWFTCLDLLLELDPEVIVPGHGPLCGIEGASEMRAYLEYVRDESKASFAAGLTAVDAATRIEFGPYSEWRAPARILMNVERAYREFRNELPDAPWDTSATFDAIYKVATAKGVPVEF